MPECEKENEAERSNSQNWSVEMSERIENVAESNFFLLRFESVWSFLFSSLQLNEESFKWKCVQLAREETGDSLGTIQAPSVSAPAFIFAPCHQPIDAPFLPPALKHPSRLLLQRLSHSEPLVSFGRREFSSTVVSLYFSIPTLSAYPYRRLAPQQFRYSPCTSSLFLLMYIYPFFILVFFSIFYTLFHPRLFLSTGLSYLPRSPSAAAPSDSTEPPWKPSRLPPRKKTSERAFISA